MDQPAAPAPATTPVDAAGARPTKAVILARGLGTRLRRSADVELTAEQQAVAATGVKALMPVGGAAGGRPFVDYLVSSLADAGLTDICLVIGPEHQIVRDHFAALELERVRISFAEQAEPLGTADAVLAAREFVGEDRFVVVNSDNHYPREAVEQLLAAPGNALLGFDSEALVANSNIPAERVAAFALLDADEAGHLTDIVEKPSPEVVAARGGRSRVSMNCFCFTPEIFDGCTAVEPSPRGEHEIVDAVRFLVDKGIPVTVVPLAMGVLDLSGRGDVASVAEALAGATVRL